MSVAHRPHIVHIPVSLLQVAAGVSVTSELGWIKVDTEHVFAIVGIVATVLNLLVVVLVYLYTAV